MNTSFKSGRDLDDFRVQIANTRHEVARDKHHRAVIALAEETVKKFPYRTDEIIEIIFDNLAQSHIDHVKPFISTVITFRQHIPAKLLSLVISSKNQERLLIDFLDSPSLRSNLAGVKNIIDYVKTIDEKMAENVIKKLFILSLKDALNPKMGTGLFDHLLKNHDFLVSERWADEKGAGNALYLLEIAQEKTSSINQQSTLVAYALNTLLNAGCDPNKSTFINATNSENLLQGYKFQSLMEMACWKVDHIDIVNPHFIDQLILGGVSWEGFDKGEGTSAQHIRQHPIVQAYYRREALGELLGGTLKKEYGMKM